MRPALVDQFIAATKEVYDVNAWIGKVIYYKFTKRELELAGMGISLHQYTVTVLKQWKTWVAGKGWKSLPANIFTGPKALALFIKAYSMPSVDVTSSADERTKGDILNDELEVALAVVQSHLGGIKCSERDAIRCSYLSEGWERAKGNGTRPVKQAAEMVCKIYGVECTTFDYASIGEKIRARQICLESEVQRTCSGSMRNTSMVREVRAGSN
jgi:hypothetical protein